MPLNCFRRLTVLSKRVWGYDTAHFLAPDYELGFPEGNASPTANEDLIALVEACHAHGIRAE
jgi:pullulanase